MIPLETVDHTAARHSGSLYEGNYGPLHHRLSLITIITFAQEDSARPRKCSALEAWIHPPESDDRFEGAALQQVIRWGVAGGVGGVRVGPSQVLLNITTDTFPHISCAFSYG